MKNKTTYPVVDLFAGPGGLGEGFTSMSCPADARRYAFRPALSIENETHAHSTLKLRHFYREFPLGEAPDEYYEYLAGGISRDSLFRAYRKQAAAAGKSAWKCTLGKEPHVTKKRIASSIAGREKWVLVGGPPCQAYSLVGRSRMRKMPDFNSDPRHFLYREYLRTIADHEPPVFVMENVKGLLSAKVQNEYVINQILRDLRAPGKVISRKSSGATYKLYSLSNKEPKGLNMDPRSFVVKAEEYGIPQARHRIFIVGVRSNVDIEPETLSKVPPVDVRQVISDLPVIRSGLSRREDSYEVWKNTIANIIHHAWFISGKTNGFADLTEEARKVLRTLDSPPPMKLSSEKYSANKTPMTSRFRDDRLTALSSHESRSHMDSDIQRYFFASLYAKVNKVSPKLADFPRRLLPKHQNVQLGRKGKMFSDRFRVQLADAPSTTITSHISKDGHYFIHHDPKQCRSLTVREAARLQTFPDNYKFEGPRTSQYAQVGNAVPPLLANHIAEIIYDLLSGIR